MMTFTMMVVVGDKESESNDDRSKVNVISICITTLVCMYLAKTRVVICDKRKGKMGDAFVTQPRPWLTRKLNLAQPPPVSYIYRGQAFKGNVIRKHPLKPQSSTQLSVATSKLLKSPPQQHNFFTMSGKGKAGKSGGKSGDASKSQSRSAKAGLQFPVGRIHRLLKRGNYAQRVGAGAPGESLMSVLYNRISANMVFLLLFSLPCCCFRISRSRNSRVSWKRCSW